MSGAESGGPFESASVPEGYRRYLEPVIFEPWAWRLLEFVGVAPGQVVLDVAAGTGVVARAAATTVGTGGRVIASDISPGMLAHVATGQDPDGAQLETLECSATDLSLADGSVDVVLCQQGFPFIPDRAAAAREMCRVLRPGGKAGAAVWLFGGRLEPFETYAELLQAEGLDEPFPAAFDTARFAMSVSDVEQALLEGGFEEVEVTTEDLELVWPSPTEAALGITGTPYRPAVAALDDERQQRLLAMLRDRMTGPDGAPVRHVTTVVLGRGVAGSHRR